MRSSVVSILNVAENFDIRIDAEYFDLQHLTLENNVVRKTWKYLEDISDVKGGKRLPLGENFSDEGIPYIRAEDIKNNLVEYENSPKISYELHRQLKQYQATHNDILVTIVGNSIGDVGIVKFKLEKCNMTENCAKITNSTIIPEYLFAFLISKYGKSQITREKVGTAQPKLAIVRIRKFKIPILMEEFQKLIQKSINKSDLFANEAKILLNEAKKILLKELNILDWQPEHKLYSIKKYSDVEKVNRYDAEYFQPKYDEIIEKIKSYSGGWDTLGNLIEIHDKNTIPKNDTKYKYIELSNLSKGGEITGSTVDFGCNLPTRSRRLVNTNDVIISSIEGSLDSVAMITEEYNKSFCSNGFYVLASEFYNSETLLCLMKSLCGQMQLKKGCSGTILTAIGKDELEKIVLPKIKKDVQEKIKENIQKMYKYKCQSKQLLEIAKRGVEIAIEENEDIATDWINEQLSELRINLN